MRQAVSVRRWLSFGLAAAVLLTGITVLSAGSSLAPVPEPDPTPAVVTSDDTQTDGSAVVDRLNTWAETKGKGKTSAARGGGKHH
jgi:hypothetical protein